MFNACKKPTCLTFEGLDHLKKVLLLFLFPICDNRPSYLVYKISIRVCIAATIRLQPPLPAGSRIPISIKILDALLLIYSVV